MRIIEIEIIEIEIKNDNNWKNEVKKGKFMNEIKIEVIILIWNEYLRL